MASVDELLVTASALRRAAMLVISQLALGCTSVFIRLPDAASLVEGTAPPNARRDTTAAPFAASLDWAAWHAAQSGDRTDFWGDVAGLDASRAERDAVGLDQRTFAAALRHLIESDPQGAAIAFHALQKTATDPLVRNRARDGLTMALRWYSDWADIAGLEPDRDSVSASELNRSLEHEAVERWARTLARIPAPTISFADTPIVLPLRRSRLGTPIVRVLVNGRPHEFWLDTGASMTVISASVAIDAGVRFAAHDTLSLGVIGGSIDARAGLIDSVALGGFIARGVATAVVDPRILRLDYKVERGQAVAIPIDGVIGVDLLRWMDLVIDVPARTITISRPRAGAQAPRNLFWVGFPVVRLIARGGQPLLFGLDTGAEDSFVTLALLRKLPRTHVALRRGHLGGLGGREEPTEWVATDLTVSDGEYAIELHNAPVGAARPSNFVSFDGIIGSDVALQSRLHLDFENGVFNIRPSGDALAKGAATPDVPRSRSVP